MNFCGVAANSVYSAKKHLGYTGNKAITSNNFTDKLQEIGASDTEKIDAYTKYLKSKYGNLRIENVKRDKESLEHIAKTMRGDDVIIAPNMLEKMATDQETALKIEGIIDKIHANIPKYQAEAAAKGLTFESLGVIVHEDGTVTHICGGGDTPERIREVDCINREKEKKKLLEMKRRQESAEKYTAWTFLESGAALTDR